MSWIRELFLRPASSKIWEIDMTQPQDPPGQEKMHTIKNTNTGEIRQITQEEWRTNGQQLRAEGWVRVDEPESAPKG